jgi:hypothetical protein
VPSGSREETRLTTRARPSFATRNFENDWERT